MRKRWTLAFCPILINTKTKIKRYDKNYISNELAEELFANGQVSFQYANAEGNPTTDAPFNPNGSYFGIEGIISKDGQILGKMGHTERYDEGLMKNIHGNRSQSIFENAVNYFKNK